MPILTKFLNKSRQFQLDDLLVPCLPSPACIPLFPHALIIVEITFEIQNAFVKDRNTLIEQLATLI